MTAPQRLSIEQVLLTTGTPADRRRQARADTLRRGAEVIRRLWHRERNARGLAGPRASGQGRPCSR